MKYFNVNTSIMEFVVGSVQTNRGSIFNVNRSVVGFLEEEERLEGSTVLM